MSRYGRYSGYGYFQYRPKVNKDKFFKANPGCKPVVIDGQTIAKTFWGQRWCRHFDGMADYANRLARGRTYARNGSVCHLDITAGKVEAVVAGSDFYKVNMDVKPLPLDKWNDIKKKCHGQISTIVDLLLGRFSPDVMEIICDAKMGMFPNEDEISFNCSCPDWAQLCKHIGAVFCSIGNRLDQSPELLFLLRRVDPSELLEGSAKELVDGAQGTDADALDGDLSSIFGVEIAQSPTSKSATSTSAAKKTGTVQKETKAQKETKTAKKAKEPKPTAAAKTKGAKVKAAKEAAPLEPGRLSDDELLIIINDITESKKNLNFSVKTSGLKPDFDNIKNDEIQKIMAYCCMTLDDFAKAVGLTKQCIKRWESVEGPIGMSASSRNALKSWWNGLS